MNMDSYGGRDVKHKSYIWIKIMPTMSTEPEKPGSYIN
jgi:hypothetical protein